MNPLFPIVAEWVRTNGTAPGFKERLIDSKPLWSKVDETGKIVYRGQGHSKPGIVSVGDPKTLVAERRPVLATSDTLASVLDYAGEECCIFEIHLAPGTPYINVNEVVSSVPAPPESGEEAGNKTLDALAEICKTISPVVRKQTRRGLWNTIKSRETENEIMVYGIGGQFDKMVASGSTEDGKETFTVNYSVPTGGGRGRTFRRKAKRLNKNGHRPPRQSLRRRNRNT
jgi:hypothetical protein